MDWDAGKDAISITYSIQDSKTAYYFEWYNLQVLLLKRNLSRLIIPELSKLGVKHGRSFRPMNLRPKI